MKTKSTYLYLLIFINIAPFCFAKGKEDEKPFKCPCTCSCIELATDGIKPTSALNSLPYDEPFMLYWKKDNADVLNGKFTVFSKNDDLLESGNVSSYGGYLIAKVSKFLPPNQDFTFKFEIMAGAALEVRQIVKTEIIDFFIGVNRTTNSFGQVEVDNLRKSIIANLPISAIKFIKPGGILDISRPYTFKNSDGDLYQVIKPINDALSTKIPTLVHTIINISNPTFNNELHLSSIRKRHGKTIYENIQKINTDTAFAADVFKGKINIGTGDTLTRLSKIENIDKKIIGHYIKNIDNLIFLTQKWELSIHLNPQVTASLQSIKSDYQSIDVEIQNIKSHLDDVETGSLVEKILSSFELKVDSDIINLETSARAYVGADIGAMMVNLTGKPDAYRVIPYLGVNMYFAPINKKAPLNRLYDTYNWKVIWRMLSVHAGVTIPTMTSADYQGIFNLQNPKGFMVGIGIRPYRALKLNAGWLLQNKLNGNSLNDSFHIASRPYVSISLDWEVRNIIPDIKNLFTK